MKNTKVETGYGVASFVLAIFGFLLLPLFFLGIIPAILSIIYSNKQKKIKPTGLATAGLVIGIIATIINGIFVLLIVLAILFGIIDETLSLNLFK